ncbi:hypothetical protein [Moritella sp. F3]|uniref:hypothetical protein n=1 Tax=Moritella sp. F3 TaxID=2718882 RepID=UPI0018E1BDE6|nr:hypothetical protein [Moritella sp. F3]GIC78747.1 hypothetical protein FMO001_34740 [Moritella sp. F1]GIC82650.1 hypothetical protein FMO003_29310 [Moritella sp. F3]
MNRQQALQQIISFGEERDAAVSALAKFGWDPSFEVISVDSHALMIVLTKYMSGDIDADDLELWANFIECRDELECSDIEGYIYALADPEQMGGISLDNIEKMLTVLC